MGVDLNKRGKEIQDKFNQILEMPKDIVFDLPKITIIGNIQMYIENHKGIIEYGPNTVRISVSFGELKICGEMLTIRNITQDEIHIDGNIHSIHCNR